MAALAVVKDGGGDAAVEDLGDSWATLRDASERFGVSISALRKWYRAPARGGEPAIRSKMEDGPYGPQRVVNLADVAARVSGSTARPGQGPELGSDMLPVPLDAWNRMLEQLGNLHQAGQDLASATGRAAKAETTVEHLTAQLAERRAERDELKAALADAWAELEAARGHRGRSRWWHRLIGRPEDPAAGAGA